MANPLKGEVDFPVGDTVYRLRLSINEIIQVEDLTGLGIIQLAAAFNNVVSLKAGDVRAVLWGALRQYHPDVNLLGAGDIMGEARLQPTIDYVGRALQAAFPQAVSAGDKKSPSPRRVRGGTGKGSSRGTSRSASNPKPSGI